MPQNKSCHVVKQGYRVLGKSFNDSSCLQNSLPTWLSPSLALWQCCGKVAAEIFIDNAIRCREKSQDVGYEVLLRWRESVPVCGIRREVDLLGSPKGRFGLFVRSPDVVTLNGKRQDVGYEVLLRWQESVPVCGIRREVDLLGSPKGRFGLFVRPPDVVALDGEEDETIEAHLP